MRLNDQQYLATLFLLGAFLVILFRRLTGGAPWDVRFTVKWPHTIQMLAQGSVYVAVAYHNPLMIEWVALTLFQLYFAFFFYWILTLALDQRLEVDLSVVPIVLSINLFLWFKASYFFFHLLCVALAILGKRYLTREWEGRRRHIFNPSALIVAGVGVMLILLNLYGKGDIIRSKDLIRALGNTPNLLPLIFVMGLLSQTVGGTLCVALGAFIGLLFSKALATMLLVEPLQAVVLHTSVFIGITLLITDPATTPRKPGGQLAFGFVYGITVAPVAYVLAMLGFRNFFDKIMMVPILNYLNPRFDRIFGRLVPDSWPRYAAPVYVVIFSLCLYFVQDRVKSTPALKKITRSRLSR